jgi:hypothetical protein
MVDNKNNITLEKKIICNYKFKYIIRYYRKINKVHTNFPRYSRVMKW